MKTGQNDRLPRRGGALSNIVSALRIERKQVKESGTHKRLYADQGDVSEAAIDDEITSVVGAFFNFEYLLASGLTAEAAEEHNKLVTEAVSHLLRKWDQLAVMQRHAQGQLDGHRLGMLIAVLGVDQSLTVQAAAYDHLFGHLHPVRKQLSMFWRKDGLTEFWTAFQKRLARSPSLNDLHRRTSIAKNTLREILKGKLPGGGVILQFARGLGTLELVDGEPRQTVAEIEFEIRTAAAVHEVRRSLRTTAWARDCAEGAAHHFGLFKAAFSDTNRDDVVDLLVKGIDAAQYPKLHEVIAEDAVVRLNGYAHAIAGRAAHLERLALTDPLAAAELGVLDLRATTVNMRRDDPDESLLAEFIEYIGDFPAAVLAGRTPPTFPPEKMAKVRAMFLTMEAITPWDAKTPEQREALYRQAIRVCPTSVSAHDRLAAHLIETGRREEALAEYREIIRNERENADGWFHLVANLMELKQWAEALEVLEDCPLSTLALRGCRGVCLAELGRLDEAERMLVAVLDEDKKSVYALGGLARVHEARGDKRTSSDFLRKAWFQAGHLSQRKAK